MDEAFRNVEPMWPAPIEVGEQPTPLLPSFGPEGPRPEVVAALQAHPRFPRRAGLQPPASSTCGKATAC